ncbi:hypothetical protein NA57DRAFT_63956 [Rhizodiscina lignyota]|uniref:Nucleoporin NUP49/NSP49 n=1 Tax=Rhizodiscina lignyota TaxID=1504668 RepID=A0A9P4ILM4_9PEZI|nr:hypothetical protein NA57DRAFT_63956 [Rhizodiscina lignyota]
MAGFGRSNSLSINTGNNPFGASSNTSQPAQGSNLFGAAAAPTSNLFGASTNTNQPQQSSNLFGGSTQTNTQGGGLFGNKPATGGNMFGATTTSQPQQTGGLFGATSTTSTGQTGGLFGAAQSQPQQQQTGGLFGSTQPSGGLFGNTQQPQQQQTGGLFGGAAQPQPQQQQTGGLFGASQAQPQQQSGGLFGASQQQPQQQSGGMFGASQAQPQQQSGGMFGTSQQQPQQQSGGMFGTSQQQPQQSGGMGTSLFGASAAQPQQIGGFMGGLTMGQGAAPTQQTVPGVKIDISNIRGNTRFSDLHEDLQKEIMAIDEFIQAQIRLKEQIDSFIPKTDENIRTLAPDVEYLSGKAETVELALENDAHAIKGVKDLVEEDANDAKLAFRAIENLKLPPQFHYNNGWHHSAGATIAEDDPAAPPDLIAYFSNRTDALDAQLQRYVEHVTEIEAHLRTMEETAKAETHALVMRNGGGMPAFDGSLQGRIRELARTMKIFEDAIVNIATRVGAAREEVVELSMGKYLGGSGGGGANGGGGGNGSFGGSFASGSMNPPPVPRDRRIGWS